MKARIIYFFIILFSFASVSAYAQSAKETKKMYSDEKKKNAVVDKQVQKKASKQARKEAKALTKQGYRVPVGKIPMEKQLERSWRMQYELNAEGTGQKYIIATANAVGGNLNAGKLQATNQAKLELMGQLETQLKQIIEGKLSNEEMTSDEAMSITSVVSSSRTVISGNLGQVIPVVEIYKQLSSGSYDVQVTLGYDLNEAIRVAKNAIRSDLNKRTEGLGDKLDSLL